MPAPVITSLATNSSMLHCSITWAAHFRVRERLEEFSRDYYTPFLNSILVLRIRVTYRLSAGGSASHTLFIFSFLQALCNPNNVARSQVNSPSETRCCLPHCWCVHFSSLLLLQYCYYRMHQQCSR
jgi:hypothetical protein